MAAPASEGMSKKTLFVILGVVGCVGVLLVGGVLAALLLPAVSRAKRQALRTNCAGNLRSLHQAAMIYSVQHGGRNRLLPPETGGAFWLKLAEGPKPVIDNPSIFLCPCREPGGRAGGVDFRGPAGNANRFEDSDPMGADRVGNHGQGAGGNVLTKMGSVQEHSETEPLWREAATKTRE